MILLVDLEVAQIPVGVAVCRRLELPRGAVFQPIVPARVEPLLVFVDEPDPVPMRPISLVIGATLANLILKRLPKPI